MSKARVSNSEIEKLAREWLSSDPDPDTRAQTMQWLETGDYEQLVACFGSRLTFGTAGIRGALGPGPNRMNRALVGRVSGGLAAYLVEQGTAQAGVVIGFDGRHGSRIFAQDTAAICAEKGIQCWLYDVEVATPELAHAVLYYGAAAGVMVTASHNPPSDNGYKVYWSNGAQIIPPHDVGISACIDAVDYQPKAINQFEAHRDSDLISMVPEEVGAQYVEGVLAMRPGAAASVRVVYTPMHGVGRRRMEEVLGRAGYGEVYTVPEQAEPDPDFPTVRFPNPEEPNAMDLAIQLGDKVSADVVIANDPDADRLAVCVPTKGGFRQLNGNEVGVLIADMLLSKTANESKRRLVATTIVSTPLLEDLARYYGVDFAQTLTGFKWIANRAIACEQAGGRFIMGFEEALGYCVGSMVRDKDGISAALVLCDIVSEESRNGRTLLDRLEEIYRRHGFYASGQIAQKRSGAEGVEQIRTIMSSFRDNPPKELCGQLLCTVSDAMLGTTVDQLSGETREWDIPNSNVLGWRFADGTLLLARPSGTEPKIKFYAYVKEGVSRSDSLTTAENRARVKVEQWLEAMCQRAEVV